MASGDSTISFAGTRSIRGRLTVERWVSASKARMVSSVSPKKSSRTGASAPAA